MLSLIAALTTALTLSSSPPPDRDALRTLLAERRATQLAHLHDYRLAKVYPHNTYQPGKLNVWIDADGHLCAVATLMQRDGQDATVRQQAIDDNFVRTATLESGPLFDWMLTSGLTHEEIVLIQFPGDSGRLFLREEPPRANLVAQDRAREDKRLATAYAVIEKTLTAETTRDAGLDLAVERLLRRPDLAAALVAQSPARPAGDHAANR